jgi:hypothetical protein
MLIGLPERYELTYTQESIGHLGIGASGRGDFCGFCALGAAGLRKSRHLESLIAKVAPSNIKLAGEIEVG